MFAQNVRVYSENAENAAPQQFGKVGTHNGGVQKRTTRAALGDISNRVPQQHADGQLKKRVLGASGQVRAQVVRPSAHNEVAQNQQFQSYRDQQFDNDAMEDEDMDIVGLDDNLLGLRDVDGADAHDPHMVTEYISDIMELFKATESKRQPRCVLHICRFFLLFFLCDFSTSKISLISC